MHQLWKITRRDIMIGQNQGVDIMKKNIWLDGMMGLVVGDALGVPVQFLSRDEIKNRPEGLVTGMEAGGVYNMPEGTWSDDSSMALATLASIIDKKEADPADIMMRFVKWELKGEYTNGNGALLL